MSRPLEDHFAGRLVLVTGGGRGIGRTTAEHFARAGARVVRWDLPGQDPQPLEGTEYDSVDVSDRSAVEAASARILADHRRVDVVINNAGVNFGHQGATTLDDETWRRILSTNLEGPVHVIRAVAPAMIERRRGVIVNTSSLLGREPMPDWAAYGAAKAGLEALTRAWSKELGPHGIRVNAVAPGFVDTALNGWVDPEAARGVVALTPLRRAGTPEDVAAVHLFLASDLAAFVTGVVIPIDGGLTL
jgi:3-oxoacyl-[acyl-carrier protein] reductase